MINSIQLQTTNYNNMEHRFVHTSSSKVRFIKSGRQRYLCIYRYLCYTTIETTRRSSRFVHFVASIIVVLIR